MAESHPDPAAVAAAVESESEEETVEAPTESAEGSTSTPAKKKKKKSKKAKLASTLGLDKDSEGGKPAAKMSDKNIETLLDNNPALKGELGNMPPDAARNLLKNMNLEELLTGMSLTGKNQKDMAS